MAPKEHGGAVLCLVVFVCFVAVIVLGGGMLQGKEICVYIVPIEIFPSGNSGGFPDERQLCQRR